MTLVRFECTHMLKNVVIGTHTTRLLCVTTLRFNRGNVDVQSALNEFGELSKCLFKMASIGTFVTRHDASISNAPSLLKKRFRS